MSTRKPKPRPIRRDLLTDKEKQILNIVEQKNKRFYKEMDIIGQRHAYVKKCVDSRVCPECGANLTYNQPSWLRSALLRAHSTCTCNNCTFIYDYGPTGAGLGPGRCC
jgi:hypothetical protein